MHLFLQFLTMIEKSSIFYVIYLNHVHIFKNVTFQEVLNILYFKIIPTISQNFDSNFWGPKLTHTLYSPLILKNLVRITCIFQIKLELLFFCFHYVNSNILVILLISCVYIVCHLGHSLPNAALHQTGPRFHQTPTPVVSG